MTATTTEVRPASPMDLPGLIPDEYLLIDTQSNHLLNVRLDALGGDSNSADGGYPSGRGAEEVLTEYRRRQNFREPFDWDGEYLQLLLSTYAEGERWRSDSTRISMRDVENVVARLATEGVERFSQGGVLPFITPRMRRAFGATHSPTTLCIRDEREVIEEYRFEVLNPQVIEGIFRDLRADAIAWNLRAEWVRPFRRAKVTRSEAQVTVTMPARWARKEEFITGYIHPVIFLLNATPVKAGA